MTSYIPTEKGQTIRQPATANLMIDSADRNGTVYPSAGNFQITKNSSILNGFFTRIGVTEVVLDWNQPNIISEVNDVIEITVSGVTEPLELPQGFYTVERALDSIVDLANTAFPTKTFTITYNVGETNLDCITTAGGAAQAFIIEDGILQFRLGFTPDDSSSNKTVGELRYPD